MLTESSFITAVRHRLKFVFYFFVSRFKIFGLDDGSQSQVNLDGFLALWTQTFNEGLRILTSCLQPLINVDALILKLANRIFDSPLKISSNHDFGRLNVS